MRLKYKYVVRMRKKGSGDGKYCYSVETVKGRRAFAYWPNVEIAQAQAAWYNKHPVKAFYYTRIRPWTIGKLRRCVLAFE